MKKDIGSIIRTMRKSADMSQTRLADKIGVSYQQVQKYEKGASKLTVDRLMQIADVFGVPVTVFLDEDAMEPGRAIGVDLKEDEARLLTTFRRIRYKRLRESVLEMIENILKAVDSRG